ncbi:hypothetical protein ACVW0Y_001104 [Pseudomonas sp. TE3786]
MRSVKRLLSYSLLGSICLANLNSAYAVPVTPVERPTVVVSYGGSTYSISSFYTNYPTSAAVFRAQPWWGNASLASALSGLLTTTAGGYSNGMTGAGILFAYGEGSGYPFIKFFQNGSVSDCQVTCNTSAASWYYAYVNQLITLDSVAESLQSTSAGVNSINNNLNLMINGAHSHPLDRLVAPGQKTFWVAGDWGRDDHGNREGSTGMAEVGVGHNLGFAQFNVSIGQTWARQNLVNDGEVKADGQYLMLESIIPLLEEHGVYATVGAFGHWGEADIRRGYINFSELDSSKASPDTQTWGLRTRLDWQNAVTLATTGVSPYVDLSYSNSHLDSYTEKGGGIPAHFDGRTDSNTEARLGFNTETPLPFAPGYNFVANLEAAHRFENHSAGVNGQIEGLFSFNLPGEDVTNDWLKAGVGVEGNVGPGKLSLMLNGTTQSEMPNFWLATSYQLAF